MRRPYLDGTNLTFLSEWTLSGFLCTRAPKAKLVELRYFGGLSTEETASVLKVSARTIKREWAMARAWLYAELADAKVPPGQPETE